MQPSQTGSQQKNSPLQNNDPETVLGYGCVLPRGNEPEFAELEGMLKKLDVPFRRIDVKGDGVMYLINESELPKLPNDRGPYMPGEDGTGHGLSKIRQKYFDLMTENGRTVKPEERKP